MKEQEDTIYNTLFHLVVKIRAQGMARKLCRIGNRWETTDCGQFAKIMRVYRSRKKAYDMVRKETEQTNKQTIISIVREEWP